MGGNRMPHMPVRRVVQPLRMACVQCHSHIRQAKINRRHRCSSGPRGEVDHHLRAELLEQSLEQVSGLSFSPKQGCSNAVSNTCIRGVSDSSWPKIFDLSASDKRLIAPHGSGATPK